MERVNLVPVLLVFNYYCHNTQACIHGHSHVHLCGEQIFIFPRKIFFRVQIKKNTSFLKVFLNQPFCFLQSNTLPLEKSVKH